MYFGEVFDLAARISLQCFFVVGKILWKSCAMDGDTLGGAATGFGVDTLGSLKMGGCCDFSAEESYDNMESSWKGDLRVMVSDGGSRRFLFICFNAEVKSLEVAIIMLVAVAVGIISFSVNNETVFLIRTESVAVIQIWWQQ